MRFRVPWRNPYNAARARLLMAEADAYCATYGHDRRVGDGGRYRRICVRCGDAQ